MFLKYRLQRGNHIREMGPAGRVRTHQKVLGGGLGNVAGIGKLSKLSKIGGCALMFAV